MTSSWQIRGRSLSLERPLVMGILNVTPDSFSDGGRHQTVDLALASAERMLAEGADLLDVGGESTRPHAVPVSAREELERVTPVIRALASRFPSAAISVDTVKSEVAAAAIAEGAHVVNDVSGLRLDPGMADLCAAEAVGVVVMHSRGGVDDMATYAGATYDGDPMSYVIRELGERMEHARSRGVARERICLDPGIGFSKRSEHSLRVLGTLSRLVALGHPVLVGVSRKRFIGELSEVAVPSERVHGSVAAAVSAYERGARIFRAHDVAATRQALNVASAIESAGRA